MIEAKKEWHTIVAGEQLASLIAVGFKLVGGVYRSSGGSFFYQYKGKGL